MTQNSGHRTMRSESAHLFFKLPLILQKHQNVITLHHVLRISKRDLIELDSAASQPMPLILAEETYSLFGNGT